MTLIEKSPHQRLRAGRLDTLAHCHPRAAPGRRGHPGLGINLLAVLVAPI